MARVRLSMSVLPGLRLCGQDTSAARPAGRVPHFVVVSPEYLYTFPLDRIAGALN
jgi:hypothetical protein